MQACSGAVGGQPACGLQWPSYRHPYSVGSKAAAQGFAYWQVGACGCGCGWVGGCGGFMCVCVLCLRGEGRGGQGQQDAVPARHTQLCVCLRGGKGTMPSLPGGHTFEFSLSGQPMLWPLPPHLALASCCIYTHPPTPPSCLLLPAAPYTHPTHPGLLLATARYDLILLQWCLNYLTDGEQLAEGGGGGVSTPHFI